jgi:hypothetical protein
VHVGLSDGWEHYEEGGNWEAAIKDIRRVVGRHNPEAMFRELTEVNLRGFFAMNRTLAPS